MLNEDAEKYICPFMSRPMQVYDRTILFEVKCKGVECMAWNPTGQNEGYCNAAFPSDVEV